MSGASQPDLVGGHPTTSGPAVPEGGVKVVKKIVDIWWISFQKTLDRPPQMSGLQSAVHSICLGDPDGTSARYASIRVKEGALPEQNGTFNFPRVGKRGAFVMEFQNHVLPHCQQPTHLLRPQPP